MYHKGEGHPDKSMSKKNLRGTTREHHRVYLSGLLPPQKNTFCSLTSQYKESFFL